MARKRDVVIGVIIAVTFIVCFGFFGLIFLGSMFSDDGVSLGGFGSKIAVIEVYGEIMDSSEIVRQLKKWGQSDNIKAIILHVNSPGGGVAASQEIYDEILRVREEDEKPVIAAMHAVAASGGYYIACATDKIIANPGTITGSIGVILQFPTAGELFEKIGIEYHTIKSGELKDVGSLDRPMTENERKMLTAMIMDTYEQFVDVVADGRQMDRELVYELANGAVYSGRQAYEHDLVDALGGFEEAVRMTAEIVGIEGEPDLIREYRPEKNIWDILGSFLGDIDHKFSGTFSGPRIMYLY